MLRVMMQMIRAAVHNQKISLSDRPRARARFLSFLKEILNFLIIKVYPVLL